MTQDLVAATAKTERIKAVADIAVAELETQLQQQSEKADLYLGKYQTLQTQHTDTSRYVGSYRDPHVSLRHATILR